MADGSTEQGGGVTSTPILVLGGGTAGLIAALTFRARMPGVAIRLIRSPSIGIIGVGEGTTAGAVSHLFGRQLGMGLDVGEFYRTVNPIWKLGIRYIWGPRGEFIYPLGRPFSERPPLPRSIAYYAGPEAPDVLDLANTPATLMAHGKAFVTDPASGGPVLGAEHAFHLENKALVGYLESVAARSNITIVDDTVVGVDTDDNGVRALRMASGRVETATLYVDCSGFRSELLGRALNEPFISYRKTLFCDRAVVGGWPRGADEPIQCYTTAETMDAGWSWRIDHEHWVNRGYVYGGDFLSDDAAEAEFRRANPKVKETRVVKFRSGRFERFAVKNVVAIGNASGFVEPLEATAITALCYQSRAVATALFNVGKLTPAMWDQLNHCNARYWDIIPRFLAVHYKFNTLRDTPFWRAVQSDIDLYGAEPIVDYYSQCGPDLSFDGTLTDSLDMFGLAGYYVMLVGQNVPHANGHAASGRERAVLDQWRQRQRHVGRTALTAEQALAAIRGPGWQWNSAAFA